MTDGYDIETLVNFRGGVLFIVFGEVVVASGGIFAGGAGDAFGEGDGEVGGEFAIEPDIKTVAEDF